MGLRNVSIGAQARRLGHDVQVVRVGKRFRLVCSCGLASQVNWKRKTSFDFMTEHVSAVVRVAKRAEAEAS